MTDFSILNDSGPAICQIDLVAHGDRGANVASTFNAMGEDVQCARVGAAEARGTGGAKALQSLA